MDLTFFKTNFSVYPDSIHPLGEESCFMVDCGDRDCLCITGHDSAYPGEPCSQSGHDYTLCQLDHAAAVFLREHYPFCVPAPVLERKTTMGVGDRLGLAGEGHLRVFKEYDVFPVLAQQSMRELRLTHRTMDEVIDSSTFAVFRAGYHRGFGADGDHLKTVEEVQSSLACGCTMITLDCSEFIDNEAAVLPDGELEKLPMPEEKLRARYLDRQIELGPELTLRCTLPELRRMLAVYGKSIDFIAQVYYECLLPCGHDVSYEISLDETLTVTSPLAHYFVANELKIRGVRFATMAPRFSGEFQKGIDYVGNACVLREEVKAHNAIAKYFGYKVSFHSGSDKFSVFGIMNEQTQGRFHVKTAGTSWLEALRVLARLEPALFRRLYATALESFEDNRAFYHVTPDMDTVPDVDKMEDGRLPELLDLASTRQILHIAYGRILDDGELKKAFFQAMRKHRQAYSDALYAHIGRHAQYLGIPRGRCGDAI